MTKPRKPDSRAHSLADTIAKPFAFGRRVFGVISSKGPGYEAQPPGLHIESDRVGGYFLDYRLKTEAKAARSPDSLLPVTLAQLALGWYERMLLGDSRAWHHFEDTCRVLKSKAEESDGVLLWPYDEVIPKYGLRSRRYDGMTQAQAASTFVRAFLHSRRSEYEIAARAAIEPLLRMDGRFVAMTPSGPILEEGGMTPPAHILNGWIFAIWGLWDVRVGLGEPRTDSLLSATIECLRTKLHEYDVGWWTRYSLFPHVLPDLAKPFYHRIHIDQMEVLHRLTGIDEFGSAARRWESYNRRSARLVAVAHKIPFKIVDAVASPAQ
jgi:heparosan-N-sulfate-glucuronate 5-epimerase